MSNTEILKQALKLPPEERFIVVEGLLNSLDVPDQKVDGIWAEEAEKRLEAYRVGRLTGIPMEQVFEPEP
jgi:putative addiction module component (TIGR02574 family)